MTREFIDKVERKRIVDTRKYRYVFGGEYYTAWIKRIEIAKLDTVAAYDGSGWEIVWSEDREEHW